MKLTTKQAPKLQQRNKEPHPKRNVPGQKVLVLQGGGALGAYQAGVYQGLSEAGIEPDWIVGTSIGAINAALIAGNKPADRLERLKEFWDRVRHRSPWARAWLSMFGNTFANFGVLNLRCARLLSAKSHCLFGFALSRRTRVGIILWHRSPEGDACRASQSRLPE